MDGKRVETPTHLFGIWFDDLVHSDLMVGFNSRTSLLSSNYIVRMFKWRNLYEKLREGDFVDLEYTVVAS